MILFISLICVFLFCVGAGFVFGVIYKQNDIVKYEALIYEHRKIINECAESLGSGANVKNASLDFCKGLPEEIYLTINSLRYQNGNLRAQLDEIIGKRIGR